MNSCSQLKRFCLEIPVVSLSKPTMSLHGSRAKWCDRAEFAALFGMMLFHLIRTPFTKVCPSFCLPTIFWTCTRVLRMLTLSRIACRYFSRLKKVSILKPRLICFTKTCLTYPPLITSSSRASYPEPLSVPSYFPCHLA